MTANDTVARHRYATIAVAIPDRLDRIADQLEECLAIVARYGLAEALQPTTGQGKHLSVHELRDAATRIRIAAAYISGTGRPPGTIVLLGARPVHGTAAGS